MPAPDYVPLADGPNSLGAVMDWLGELVESEHAAEVRASAGSLLTRWSRRLPKALALTGFTTATGMDCRWSAAVSGSQ